MADPNNSRFASAVWPVATKASAWPQVAFFITAILDCANPSSLGASTHCPGARLCRRPAAAASQRVATGINRMPPGHSKCCGWSRTTQPRSASVPFGGSVKLHRSSLLRPFILITGWRFVKGRTAVKAIHAVPIHPQETHMSVHKAHDVAGIGKLVRLLALVGA